MRLFMKSVSTGLLAAVVGSAFVAGCGGQQGGTEPSPGAVGEVSRAVVSRRYPQRVTSLSGVQKVGVGSSHAFAMTSDGSRWGWGNNNFGQVGTGTTSPSSYAVPTPLQSGLSDVVDFDGGVTWFSVALTSTGNVLTYGFNAYGQLGNGTTSPSTLPVLALTNAKAVAAGTTHTVALRNDGTLWAWGQNFAGELGNGTYTSYSASPVQVTGLSGVKVTSIAAGNERTFAVDSSGNVWVWGYQTASNGDPVSVPQLAGISSAEAVASSTMQAAILKKDGSVSVLGLRGAVTNVTGLPAIKAIAAGVGHFLAVGTDGSLWAWGTNTSGQLGDGSTTNSMTPVRVSLSDAPNDYLKDVVSVAAADEVSFAVLADGTLWSWGADNAGMLGTNNQ